jgi:4-carboxymuconolactone decarboxylase
MSKRSTGNEVLRQRRAAGRAVREQVEGKVPGEAPEAESDGFLRMYHDAHDEFCWGSIWTRPLLSIRIRSLLSLALTAAKNQASAVEKHVRMALNTGVTREEIAEVFLHVYCYAGCYAAQEAFIAAKRTFDAIDGPKGDAQTIPGSEASSEPAEIEIEKETSAWTKRLGSGTALAERGLQIRREILGREMIDESMAQTVADPFMSMFMEATHEYCFGTVWARPGLERRMRSVLALAINASQGLTGAVKRHVRSCVHAGLSKEEIGEIFLQVYVYSGVYACFGSFLAAKEVFDDMEREGIRIRDKGAFT